VALLVNYKKLTNNKMIKNKILAAPLATLVIVGLLGAIGFVPLVSAQTGSPRVQIQLATTGLTTPLVAGTENAVVARLSLNTTGSSEPVRITNLPFVLSAGAGAQAGSLSSCRVYNEANPGVILNAPIVGTTTPATNATPTATTTGVTGSLVSGLNNITLATPVVLQPNTTTIMGMRCNVASDLVAGGTYTFSMNTSNFIAVGDTTGNRAIVTVPSAEPTTPPVVPVTPGLPPTGLGGESTNNFLVMLGSVLAMTFGLAYAIRNTKKI
jgi:hypothetical protein